MSTVTGQAVLEAYGSLSSFAEPSDGVVGVGVNQGLAWSVTGS